MLCSWDWTISLQLRQLTAAVGHAVPAPILPACIQQYSITSFSISVSLLQNHSGPIEARARSLVYLSLCETCKKIPNLPFLSLSQIRKYNYYPQLLPSQVWCQRQLPSGLKAKGKTHVWRGYLNTWPLRGPTCHPGNKFQEHVPLKNNLYKKTAVDAAHLSSDIWSVSLNLPQAVATYVWKPYSIIS